MKVRDVGTSVASTLTNAPLPQLIGMLGLSIAEAQAALDRNSIAMAEEMAATEVNVGGETYNMISLGFIPTFYAFTDATVEAKVAFSMSKSVEFGVDASVDLGQDGPLSKLSIAAVSVEASYSQKFSMSAEGSSSIAARLVSLPAPDIFKEILQREYQQDVNRQIEETEGSVT